jgi:hypothetical protein
MRPWDAFQGGYLQHRVGERPNLILFVRPLPPSRAQTPAIHQLVPHMHVEGYRRIWTN